MNRFYHLLSRHKYVVTGLFFFILIGFVDTYSYLHQWELRGQNERLSAQIRDVQQKDSIAQQRLADLQADQNAVEQVARVQLLMHTPEEDVFIVKEKE